MFGDGLRPLLGIIVVVASESRTARMPLQLYRDWQTRNPRCQTFQNDDFVEEFDENNLPDKVFRADGFPAVREQGVVDIWGDDTCPPRAYEGVKVHGSMEVTAFFITPSEFGRVQEPCLRPRDRVGWAKERFVYTVRGNKHCCFCC